jgi:hypothetical protein
VAIGTRSEEFVLGVIALFRSVRATASWPCFDCSFAHAAQASAAPWTSSPGTTKSKEAGTNVK